MAANLEISLWPVVLKIAVSFSTPALVTAKLKGVEA